MIRPPPAVAVFVNLVIIAILAFFCLHKVVQHLDGHPGHTSITVEPMKRRNHFVRFHQDANESRHPYGDAFWARSTKSYVSTSVTVQKPWPGTEVGRLDVSAAALPGTETSVETIYMDWIGDSDEFTYLSYRSLESLLSSYSRTRVTVNLIASNGAYYYKMGNLISKHYFQKYLKYGYDVRVNIVYRKFRVRFSNDTLPPGAAYWNGEYEKCCESSKATEINLYRDIPAHLYFYLRFFSLWSRGGLYTDFSWIHRKELKLLSDTAGALSGAIINLICPESPSVAAKTVVDTATVEARKRSHCKSSALLAFAKGSAVAFCMMLQYNSTDTSLMQCLPGDVQAEGVNCVIAALKECFSASKVQNAFLHRVPANPDMDVLIGCADVARKSTYDVNSVMNIKEACNTDEGPYRNALFRAPSLVQRLAGSVVDGGMESAADVVWLGAAAYSGDWAVPQVGSVLGNLLQRQTLARGPYYKDVLADADLRNRDVTAASYAPYPLKVLGRVSPVEAQYLEHLRNGTVTPVAPSSTGCSRYNYSVALSPSMRNQVRAFCL
jgi:hypothetical protein